MLKRRLFLFIFSLISVGTFSQTDSLEVKDSLRIINFSSYFTQHIDSNYVYQFRINKETNYYWYLSNAPVGLSINKDNGVVSFKAAKNYFLSGKLRYDFPYKVSIGVKNLKDQSDKIDTSFTILFYNTEIIPSKIKPSVSGTIFIAEGDTLNFDLQCEQGSFPVETVVFSSNLPIQNYTFSSRCGSRFSWSPGFDFTSQNDSARTKILHLTFTGSTRFGARDTAYVRVAIRDALNYPLAKETNETVRKNTKVYILQLKYAFMELDRKIKRVKRWRTGFDLTSASSALTGTILNTSSSAQAQKTGKILPSVGLALTPIKEATTPQKVAEQNQASTVRNAIRRLEFLLQDTELIGEKDTEIVAKTDRLRNELRQLQVQLIDVPLVTESGMTEEELNDYFNSPKVNKKYRLR